VFFQAKEEPLFALGTVEEDYKATAEKELTLAKGEDILLFQDFSPSHYYGYHLFNDLFGLISKSTKIHIDA
jgi:hypothetical protein